MFLQNLNEEWLRKQGVPPADVPRPIHRVYDDSFRKLDIDHYYDKMTVPTINIGGWYDIFSQGNIDCFEGLQYRGGEGAKGNQKLVMGAFGHGLLRGDLKYPDRLRPGRPGHRHSAGSITGSREPTTASSASRPCATT